MSQPSRSKKTQKRLKKTGLCSLGEEDPCEEERTFKPAEFAHFQNGDDNSPATDKDSGREGSQSLG
jgi:hypothetical protein